MNKTRQLFFLLCTMFLFTTACSKDDNKIPAEESIKGIINALKGMSGLDQFANALSWLNFSAIETDQFTVFAVKNSVGRASLNTSGKEGITSEDVKHHMVSGSYRMADLTDGMVLMSLANDSIVVTKVGENVSINGIPLDGKEVKADKSIIYVISELLPVYHSLTTLFTVNECNGNWTPENNAAGFPVADASVKIYQQTDPDSDDFVLYKTLTTNAAGVVSFKHQQDIEYYYSVNKGKASNIHNGYILLGVYVSEEDINNSPETIRPVKPGDLKYADINYDGIINSDDKMEVPYLPIDSSEDGGITCYIY